MAYDLPKRKRKQKKYPQMIIIVVIPKKELIYLYFLKNSKSFVRLI